MVTDWAVIAVVADDDSDGSALGPSVGGSVCTTDGTRDGDSDGGRDGESDGGRDGESDGGRDGDLDGGRDGDSDGGPNGTVERRAAGEPLGDVDGALLGAASVLMPRFEVGAVLGLAVGSDDREHWIWLFSVPSQFC